MFDQWKPDLDFVEGCSLTNQPPYCPQGDQSSSGEGFSMESLLDYDPMMLSSLLLLPMPLLKPQGADPIPSSGANPNRIGEPAFTSDVVFTQPIQQSIQPLDSRECLACSPASSPNGSCSDLSRAPGPQFLYSSPSNADYSEAISDVGCSTPVQSKQPELFASNYCSEALNECFLNRPQDALMWDQVPTNSMVPNFGGLSQSARVLPYPTETLATASTAGVSASPVSLISEIFPFEAANDFTPTKNKQTYDQFSSQSYWTNDFGNFPQQDAANFHIIPHEPSSVYSRCTDVSIKRHDASGDVPIVKLKRFPCPECGQRFARAFNLQTHIATHAGMRPFSCPADGCSKAFSRRHDLGRHVGAVHREWLASKNISVEQAVKPLRWKNGSSKKSSKS
ncbi:hypothetical protein PGT21_018185 [Puccinia graminis f. sp. tritici]|uniref:C2H2-type domain-containing protein n=1 Tax=Puccinia graminis f. sp. tritici TaxID=56615 RepID=A0A5B0LVZ6_PUCGR|nr:hypothetical protein PGTUg99_034654 [Puccinia graminis f. sp. tritici]KAA1104288.1 hypothetical protein PGT21_018185 [Puccinia graminis f. sp. tritici]